MLLPGQAGDIAVRFVPSTTTAGLVALETYDDQLVTSSIVAAIPFSYREN